MTFKFLACCVRPDDQGGKKKKGGKPESSKASKTSKASGGSNRAPAIDARLSENTSQNTTSQTSQVSASSSPFPKDEPECERPRSPLQHVPSDAVKAAAAVEDVVVTIPAEAENKEQAKKEPETAQQIVDNEASTSGRLAYPNNSLRRCQSADCRPAPTNPLTFLKVVVDDVQRWRTQVEAIKGKPHDESLPDGAVSGEDVVKQNMERLQSRNEELLGELDRLSSRLQQAENDLLRMRLHVENLTGEKSDLKSEIGRIQRQRSEEVSNLRNEIRSLEEQSRIIRSAIVDGARDMSTDGQSGDKLSNPDDPDGATLKQEGSSVLSPDGELATDSKGKARDDAKGGNGEQEEYYHTENKCLKIWIAKMQGTISQMETEMFSMRQEKGDLLGLLSRYRDLDRKNTSRPRTQSRDRDVSQERPPSGLVRAPSGDRSAVRVAGSTPLPPQNPIPRPKTNLKTSQTQNARQFYAPKDGLERTRSAGGSVRYTESGEEKSFARSGSIDSAVVFDDDGSLNPGNGGGRSFRRSPTWKP